MADGAIIGKGHYRTGVKTTATTNNTPATLASITLPTGTEGVFVGRARVLGVRYDTGGSKLAQSLVVAGTINGGALAVVSAVEGSLDDGAGYTIAIDVSGADVRIRVTGVTAHSVRWIGELELYPREQAIT